MTGRGRTTRLGGGCFKPRKRLFGGHRDLVTPVRSRVCGTIGSVTSGGKCTLVLSHTSSTNVVFTSPGTSVDGRVLAGLKCSGWRLCVYVHFAGWGRWGERWGRRDGFGNITLCSCRRLYPRI